jgi:hypothetical protein
MSRFLNRILGIRVQMQNVLFRFFSDALNAVIVNARRSGSWDLGILGKNDFILINKISKLPFFFVVIRSWYRRRNSFS